MTAEKGRCWGGEDVLGLRPPPKPAVQPKSASMRLLSINKIRAQDQPRLGKASLGSLCSRWLHAALCTTSAERDGERGPQLVSGAF